jgi:hypothetical protein
METETMGNASQTQGRSASFPAGRWLQWLNKPGVAAQRTAPPGANSEPVIVSPLQPRNLAGKWPDASNLRVCGVVLAIVDGRTAQER